MAARPRRKGRGELMYLPRNVRSNGWPGTRGRNSIATRPGIRREAERSERCPWEGGLGSGGSISATPREKLTGDSL